MYETRSVKEVCEILKVDMALGLKEDDWQRRQKKDGKNQLQKDKKKNPFRIFIRQFQDPMICILFIASLLSFFLKEYADALIILFVIGVNAIVGTIQEFKAEKSLEALKKMSAPSCLVKRNGVIQEIKAEDLVVGDIVILDEGRIVPADLRIIESNNLKIDESSLTGESLPVSKHIEPVKDKTPLADQKNMAFMSTSVVYGRGIGIVTAIGMKTEIGKIASILNETKTELTPLQKRLADLGKILGILTVLLCVSLFVVSIIQKRNLFEMLITSISLAVAAIPEGLPAAVTIVLALGVQRMVKANTIVRRLPSVETLGAVSTVCSDKTGTLTQNKMTVQKVFYNLETKEANQVRLDDIQLLVQGMVLCNNANIDNNIIGDPTEVALLEMGKYFGIDKKKIETDYPRLNEIPFDSTRKMMTTFHVHKKEKILFTKGALDMLIQKVTKIYKNGQVVPITKEDIEVIQKANHEMAKDALRVLAVAYQKSNEMKEKDLIFLGFVGMMDLPREEAKIAVENFKQAGIKTIMITGDHPDTAFAIGKKLGIVENEKDCVTGKELDSYNDEQLKDVLKHAKVFARVTPAHKVRIVQAIKSQDQIVAMTGDGVNDAPSLKAADIGIAMGITGTDVAKGASDMILVDDNFASIEKAVEEGRGIYANIKKVVLFLLSSNFGEVFTMFLAILFRLPVPLIAIHILWVNLITDTLPALALGADPKDEDIMKEKPRDAKESLFAKGGLKLTLFYGIFITLLTLLAFLAYPTSIMIQQGKYSLFNFKDNYFAIRDLFQNGNTYLGLSGEDIVMRSRTYAFTALGMSQLFHMLGMSNIKKSVLHILKRKNWLMFISFALGIALQVLVTEIPFFNHFFQTSELSFLEWIWLLLISALPLIVHEIMVPLWKKKMN